MALDIPPEVLMSNYSTSFTAHKGALNDFVKSYTLKRHNFQRTVCYPVMLEIAKYLWRRNKIISRKMPSIRSGRLRRFSIDTHYLDTK